MDNEQEVVYIMDCYTILGAYKTYDRALREMNIIAKAIESGAAIYRMKGE